MNSKKIGEYLTQLQWRYSTLDDNTIVTGYPCMVPFYDFGILIEIKTSRHWVTVRGLLQRGIEPGRRANIAALLSSLNAKCRVVRFFMVEDCAVLQTEVPVARFHPGSFIEALKNVCRYASYYGLEVSVVATNPSVGELYKTIEAATSSRFVSSSTRVDDALLEFDISANRLAD